MILLYTKRKNPHEDPAKGIPKNETKNIEMPRKITFNPDIQLKNIARKQQSWKIKQILIHLTRKRKQIRSTARKMTYATRMTKDIKTDGPN